MNVYSIFPTDIYIEENSSIDNKKLSEIILEKEKIEPARFLSNIKGWQSSEDLNRDARFSELMLYVSQSFKLIFEHNNYKDGLKLIITDMWANVNREKDFNKMHLHGNSDWSFVYYVRVPENSGVLRFADPRIRRGMSPNEDFLKNLDNPSQHGEYLITSGEGKLVIFPAWLEHWVEPNFSSDPRISISGNMSLEMN